MASFMTNKAVSQALTDFVAAHSFKIMLCTSAYTPNNDDDFVDTGGAGDAESAEITATNYARGWGGAGRKSVTLTVTEQDASNRAVIKITSPTWTALGGAVNDIAITAVLIIEGGANDTTSIIVAAFDYTTTPIQTNGSDVTLTMDATDGNIRFTT
jgi:hypothetical protein